MYLYARRDESIIMMNLFITFHIFSYLCKSNSISWDLLNTMSRNEQNKNKNAQFMDEMRKQEGVKELRGGVLYRVIEEGSGQGEVKPRSVVTCHYRGRLIGGHVFDESFKKDVPAAFRVNELISGFQIALVNMHIGDYWEVYIPAEMGYGNRAVGSIPKNATLIFEIKLISVY